MVKNKKIRKRAIRRIQERIDRIQERKKEEEEVLVKRTEAEEERLDYCGFVLSRKFKYLKLMAASREETAEIEGREVHGFAQRTFPDYHWLMANTVLDRACFFALQDYQPVIYNYIKDFDFPKMERSLVIFPEEIRFDHYSQFNFKRIIIYSDEPLEKDLTWIYNFDWVDEAGYDTTVTYAPCNLLNMGSPLHDLPVAVVKDALGKSKMFFKAKTTAEKLTEQRDETIRNQIFKLRQKEKLMDEEIEELKIESAAARKKYSDLKFKMLSRDPSTSDQKFRRWEEEYDKSQERKTRSTINYKKVFIAVVIAVFMLFMVFLLMNFFMPSKPIIPDDIPNVVSPLLNLIKKGC